MSIYGQNVLTETVEYLDAGSIFDAIVTKKIAALNTSTQSNVDLFIGATGNINLNVSGYNVLRIKQKDVNDFTTQISALNSQPLELISGDNSRTATISDLTMTQSVTKQTIKSKKGILVLDDDIEITGSLTIGQDFLVGGALIGASMNTMRTFTNSNSIGFGWRVDDNSNLELYKFDNSTNVTKKILTYGIGETGSNQDTSSYPIYGSNPADIASGVTYAANQSDNFWSSNGTDIYYSQGRMGVGTSNPGYTGHFIGEVYATTGFKSPYTTIEDGNIVTTNTVQATYFSGDGYLLSNLSAVNITQGKLQSGVMPNIINTNEVYTDTLTSSRLDVNGDIYFSGNIYQNQDLYGGGGTGLWSYNSASNSLYYTAGGVGIGTTDSKLSFQVNATDAIKVPVGTTLQRPSTSIGTGMLRYNTSTSQFEGFGGTQWTGLGGVIDVNQDTYISAETSPGANNDQLTFYTSNVQRMIVNSNGYIGIGTSNPLMSVHISGTDAIQIPVGTTLQRPSNITNIGMLRYNTTTSQFEGYGATEWSGIGGGSVIDLNQDTYISAENAPGSNNDQLKFYTSNVQRMIINSNGYIGIGTTSPSANLHLNYTGSTPSLLINNGDTSTTFTNPQVAFALQGTNQYQHFIHTRHVSGTGINNAIDFYCCSGTTNNTLASGTVNVMTLEGTGNVGIGIASPAFKLDVNGTARMNNTLAVTGATTLSSTLGVSGTTTLSSTLGVTGATILSSTLGVTGTTTLSSTLGVTGTTTLSSTLGVSGTTTLSSTLGVTGATTLNNTLFVTGSSTLNSTLGVTGSTTLSSTLGVTGISTFNNNLIVSNSSSLVGIGTTNPLYTLDVKGITNISSNLILNGISITSASNNLTINAGLVLNSSSAITLPTGSTLQRPLTSNNGMIRYNTDSQTYEGFANSNWSAIGGSSVAYWSLNSNDNISSKSNVYFANGAVSIGTSNCSGYTFKVSNSNQILSICNSNGDLLQLGNTSTGTKLLVDSTGNITTKGTFQVRDASDSFNFISSLSDYVSLMGISDYYANISSVTIPSTYLLTKYNNNTFYTTENIQVEFRANNTSKVKVSNSISGNSTSYYNTSTTKYAIISINSNNYFTFCGDSLSYDVNILRNITSAHIGIGIITDLEKTLEVGGDTQITGNLLVESGDIYLNGQVLDFSSLSNNTTIFQSTTSNIYYTGHTTLITENYNTSNNVYTTDYSTIFGITQKFLNLVNLNLPGNLPVIYPTNYIMKANKNLSITLSADVDGSTAYVGNDINSLPLFTYIGDINANIQITVPQNYYLAVVGI